MSDTPSSFSGAEGVGHLQQILSTLGGRPVLLPIELGKKGPRYAGWQKLTWEQTQDPEFRLRLPEPALPGEALTEGKEVWRDRRYSDLIDGRAMLPVAYGNIGVLLGEPSVLEEGDRRWHLCSIDIDDSAAVEGFLAANPKLVDTLQTAGSRGRNFWLWVEGEYPPLHKDICWRITEERPHPKIEGKMLRVGEPDKARPWGEWRATGGQTVLYGVHPSGERYRAIVRKAPVRLTFAEINWPAGLHLPWAPAELAPPPPVQSAAPAKLEKLIEQYGDPWTVSAKGVMTINQAFFAAFFGTKHQVLYSPEEARFFRYQGEKNGLWAEQTADSVRWEFAADIKQISDEMKGVALKLINLRTTQTLNALVAMLRGSVERWRAFERQVSTKTNRPRALVHLKNGMLDLDETPPVLCDFGPQYMSRNQLNVALDEKAECPTFLGELLGKAIPKEDIGLLQKFAGQMLVGVNLSQKLLILTGTAGGGKSTLVNILAEIIGRVNVGQLRTEHLAERFEIFRLLGKTLLIGVDVPGNFMQSEGAYVIKGLVGGDLMDAEPKNGNHCFQLKGEFNVLITCNTRLKVRLDGDGDAWRRRLGIINYERPKPEKPDPNFVHRLLATESAGILNWMIEGAIMLLKDLEETGSIVYTAQQRDRVESLLAESDSVRDFVRRGCQKAPREAKITTEQLMQAYVEYCDARGWAPMAGRTVATQMPDALLEIHGATPSNDIKISSDDKAKRGYRGVALVSAAPGPEELAPAGVLAPEDMPYDEQP